MRWVLKFGLIEQPTCFSISASFYHMQCVFTAIPSARAIKVQLHAKHKFSPEEDEQLTKIVEKYAASHWKMVAAELGTRNSRQCRERWKNYLDPSLTKDPWSPQEDELLMDLYHTHGSQWALIAKSFHSRTDVSCKNRWVVLTSHTGQPKRVRGKSSKPAQSEQAPDFWTWNELELRQTYEDIEIFGLDSSRSLLH
jgi:hypothetical protein